MTTPIVVISADPEAIEFVITDSRFKLIGILDPNPGADGLGAPILGPDKHWGTLIATHSGLKAVLALDSTEKKRSVIERIGLDRLVTVISTGAYVAPSAVLGKGCLVQRGVKILSRAQIGNACKLNADVTVHHHCVVGDYCTLAPGCRLLGGVVVEELAFVGSEAVLLPKVKIGAGATVGAGAVVVDNVPAGVTVTGVPARSVRAKDH